MRAELERHGIDYYLRWRDSDRPDDVPDFLKSHPDVTEGRYPQLEIFSLKETK